MTQLSASERLTELRTTLQLSRPKFAALVDVGVHTLYRAETGDIPPSEYLIEKIDKVLKGSADYLHGHTDEIPGHLLPILDEDANAPLTEGQKLRNYLDRIRLTQSDLAQKLNVSRAMVNTYLSTSKFRSDVKERILHALGAPEAVVFGERQLTQLSNRTDVAIYKEFVALPLIRPEHRKSLDMPRALDVIMNFDLRNPDPEAWLMHRGDLNDVQLASALIFETAASDRLPFPAGSLVVGYLVTADQYGSLDHEDYVAVRAGGQLILAQVKENHLESKDELVLSLSGTFAFPLTVQTQDIEYVFKIVRLLEANITFKR